jgi:hypothetical protein
MIEKCDVTAQHGKRCTPAIVGQIQRYKAVFYGFRIPVVKNSLIAFAIQQFSLLLLSDTKKDSFRNSLGQNTVRVLGVQVDSR